MAEKLSELVPSVIALAMGVVGIVLAVIGQPADAIVPLLAIGLLVLGFAGLNKS